MAGILAAPAQPGKSQDRAHQHGERQRPRGRAGACRARVSEKRGSDADFRSTADRAHLFDDIHQHDRQHDDAEDEEEAPQGFAEDIAAGCGRPMTIRPPPPCKAARAGRRGPAP